MGNQVCCQVAINNQKFQDINKRNQMEQELLEQHEKFLKEQESIVLPELSEKIKQTMQKLKVQSNFKIGGVEMETEHQTENTHKINKQNSLFSSLLEEFQEQKNEGDINIVKVRFGRDIYHGPLDAIGRPTKIGKMYKQNHALFIGSFVSGKAEGRCVYLMENGGYYEGMMRQNIAECFNGKFVNNDFVYEGGFINNKFHGNGKELIVKNQYFFQGIYDQGKKIQGIMQWRDLQTHDEYKYQGQFDQNGLFCHKAVLTDSNGRFEGEFKDGKKNGYGVYYYFTKLRYEGFYVNDQKQGQGKLFNSDNSLAYKGIFKNGLPNGKGMAMTKGGVEFQTEWRDGIDVRLLQ